MSLSEMAQIGLDRAVQAEKSIEGSNTWQGVVEKIKWVMDTLSPVAGVRIMDLLFAYPRLSLLALSQLNPIAKMAYGVLSVIPGVRLFALLILILC